MNIFTHKIKFEDDTYSYKDTTIQTCCGKMEKCKAITLDDVWSDELHKDIYSVCLIEDVTYEDPYEDFNLKEYEYHPISNCPFCGTKINIEIVSTIDKTEEFDKLNAARYELNEKRRNTDSKKEEVELNKAIRELDILIDGYYHSDGFK